MAPRRRRFVRRWKRKSYRRRFPLRRTLKRRRVTRFRVRRKSFKRSKRSRFALATRTSKIPSLRSRVQFLRGPSSYAAARVRARLPYTTIIHLGNGDATGAFAVFRLNAPFDPEYAIGGAAPVGYTELALRYNRAVLHGATFKAKATIRDTASAQTHAMVNVVGLHKTPIDPDTSMAGFDTLEELQLKSRQRHRGERFWWRQLSRSLGTNGIGTGKNGSLRLPPMRCALRQQAFNERFPYGRVGTAGSGLDPYGVTFNVDSPPENPYFVTLFAFALPQDGQTPLDILPLPHTYFEVTIWYDIEFFQPELVTQQ